MVKAILFDVFGTIVDWRKGLIEGTGRSLARFGAEIDRSAFVDAWIDGLTAAQASTDAGHDAWRRSCRSGLEAAIAAHAGEVPLGSKDLVQLEKLWERLPPWPDSVPGLRALRREYVIAPCCDAPVSTLTWLAKAAGLPWDLVLGADLAGARLPDPALYLASARLIALDPADVMVVSAHNADLTIARSAGFRTGFFSRPREHGARQAADLAPSDGWDIVAFDLLDLARHLESAVY